MRYILICSIILSLSSATGQRTCFPGTFRVGTTCMSCPPGTYSPGYNRLSCTKCPKATFRSKSGAKSRKQCIPCAAGTASRLVGAASCIQCKPGTDALPRSLRCRRCPAGSELANELPGCKECQPNYVAPKPGTNVCSLCPVGTIAPEEGSTKCMKCPPGTFRSEHENPFNPVFRCKPCVSGSFSDKRGSRVCKICPPGTFSNGGAIVCTQCPRNTFNSRIPARACEPCPAESSTSGSGAAACKHQTKDCPFGTFEDKRGVCIACSPGEKVDTEQRICVPCEENEVSDGGATTACRKCPPGKVRMSEKFFKEKFRCVCAPGTIERIGMGCVSCPAGSFWVDNTFDDSRTIRDLNVACDSCEPGTFAENPGSVECKKCPLNKFSDVSGSETCQPCPSGFKSPRVPVSVDFYYKEIDRGTCVGEETGCAPGELFAEKGGCKTVTCPSRNKFLGVNFREQERCLSCSRDSKVVIDSSGIQRCVTCGEDEYSPGRASTACMKCPAGQMRNLHYNSRQLQECVCKNGETLMNGRCVETCPRGWASRLISVERNTGLTNTGFAGCARCAGISPRFVALSTGTGCVECPKNNISVNSTRCVRCPKGEIVAQNLFGELMNNCRPKR